MLRRNKALSIVMTMCLCLALLAPVFVAPPAAEAAVNYSALSVPALSDNTAGQALGIIQIDLDNCAAIESGDALTISFSSEINLDPVSAAGPVALTPVATRTPAGGNEIVVPATIGTAANALDDTASFASAVISSTRTTLDITFNGTFRAATPGSNPGRLLIYLPSVTVGSIDGNVDATILGPASGAFPSESVTVGKVSTSGDVVATVKSVKTYGTGGGTTDTIIISESIPGTLTAGDVLKLKLPNGFSWTAGQGTYNWGWAGSARAGAFLGVANPAAPVANTGDYMDPTAQIVPDANDDRILRITIPAATTSVTGSGQIRFAANIAIDDEDASEGEVAATLSDTAGDINEQDLKVLNYASYGASAVEGTTKELIAGKHDQKLGTFYIKEGVGGSLLDNRNIKITLPKGVKWSGTYESAVGDVPPNPTREKGNAVLAVSSLNSTYDTLKLGVTGGTTKSEWKFKDYKVDISPDFSGDLKITVAGDAGVTGEVLVATVKPAVELSAEDTTDVRIGEQSQKLGTLVIKESQKENIALKSSIIDTWDKAAAINNDVTAQDGVLAITLPSGAEWGAGYPTVTVTEGNLQLKLNDMSKSNDNRTIFIPVKSESTTASTIKISDMKVTLYRTVPEGDFKVSVSGIAINETGGEINNVELAFPQYEDLKVAVAKCVTPAPDEGTKGAASGQFRIDSNIYQVNGVSKIMDTAPYIKNNRTYVPVRFLGYALGLTDADIVWDEATQKVTFTQGSNVVELTIGSTTYTVNGEAMTMDVAPEITNSRTMLPARYVAEGLGYVVGWDPATQTVLVSK